MDCQKRKTTCTLLSSESDSDSDIILDSGTERLSRPQKSANVPFPNVTSGKSERDVTFQEKDALDFELLSDLASAQIPASSSKAQRKLQLDDERRGKIQEAFAKYEAGAANSPNRIAIIVSKRLFEDRSQKDVLKQLRAVSPQLISYDNRRLSNLISWHLKPTEASSSQSPSTTSLLFSLLVFEADEYVAHIKHNTLDNLCETLKESLQGPKTMLVISGTDRYCKQMARDACKPGRENLQIVSKAAVQDSYASLLVNHGIRTHDIESNEELSHYLYDISNAVSKLPHFQDESYFDSTWTYAKKRIAVHDDVSSLGRFRPDTNTSGGDDQENLHEEDGDASKSTTKSLSSFYLHMICLIPGISIQKAKAIQDKYPTLLDLFNACDYNPLIFSEINYTEKNRIGPKTSRDIFRFFTSLDPTMNVSR